MSALDFPVFCRKSWRRSLRLPPSLCELRRTGCLPRATLCRPFRAHEGWGRKPQRNETASSLSVIRAKRYDPITQSVTAIDGRKAAISMLLHWVILIEECDHDVDAEDQGREGEDLTGMGFHKWGVLWSLEYENSGDSYCLASCVPDVGVSCFFAGLTHEGGNDSVASRLKDKKDGSD